MSEYPSVQKIVFSVLLAVALFCVSGCSESDPKLLSADATVVFDFQSEHSVASSRLSVFVETESDAHRVEKISVVSRSTQYEWSAFEPVIIASDKKQWAGYTDFVCPASRQIPAGIYRFVYTDGEGREAETSFSVFYPDELVSCTASDVRAVLGDEFLEQVAVFDGNDALLYYGLKKDGWTEPAALFSSVKDSVCYRTCLVVKNATAVCVLPAIYKE